MMTGLLPIIIFIILIISHWVVYKLGFDNGEKRIRDAIWEREVIMRNMTMLTNSLKYVISDEHRGEIANAFNHLREAHMRLSLEIGRKVQ